MAVGKRTVVATAVASVALATGIAGCDPMTGGGTWSAIGKESLVTTTIPNGHGGSTKVVADTLAGTLVDAHGRAIPGTAFRDQCYRAVSSAGPKAGALIGTCTFVLNTGRHLYGAVTVLVGGGGVVSSKEPLKPVASPYGLFGEFTSLDQTGGFVLNEVSHPSAGTYRLRIRAFTLK
jgi:hypothetical protein